MHQDPEYQARRLAGLARFFDQPGARQRHSERMHAGRRNPTPAELERRRAHGRWLYATHASRPEVRARALSDESRRKAVDRYIETRMGWCPPALRATYQHLVLSKRVPAAEARAIIEAEIVGTRAHAQREIANRGLAARMRAERERAEAY